MKAHKLLEIAQHEYHRWEDRFTRSMELADSDGCIVATERKAELVAIIEWISKTIQSCKDC